MKFKEPEFKMQQIQTDNTAVKYLMNALDNIGKKDNEEELFLLKKQALIDQSKMAKDKFAFEKEKYNQLQADKIATENALINGTIAASNVDLSVPLTEDITVTEDKKINAVDSAGVDIIKKKIENDKKYQYRTINEISPENKRLLNEYNQLAENIKDPIKLRLAQIEFAKNNVDENGNSYYNGEVDNIVEKVGKGIMKPFNALGDYLVKGISYPISLFQTEEEALQSQAKIDAYADYADKFYTINNKSDTRLQDKLDAIRKKQAQSIKDSKYNKTVTENQMKLAEEVQVPMIVKNTTTKKDQLIDRTEFTSRLQNNVASALDGINKSSMDKKSKNVAILAVLKAQQAEKAIYDAQIKAQIDYIKEIRKMQMKVEADKEIARYKAEVKAAQEAASRNPQDEAVDRALKKAKTGLALAQTKKLEIENS